MSDPKTLEKFYSSEQGKIFSWFLRQEVVKALASGDEKIAALGFTTPYHLPNCINLSTEAAANSIQISEAQLPFRNADLKQIIALHYLENSALPMLALQEIWRTLEPAGSLILITPRKNSLWKTLQLPVRKTIARNKLLKC